MKITDEKSKQLGMPFPTASNRMKKNFAFFMMQNLEWDDCVVCGEKILTPNDMTYEHIVNWLHHEDGVNLFYDVDNIRFAHKKCQYRNQRCSSKITGVIKSKGVTFDKRNTNKPYRAKIRVANSYQKI